MFRNRLFEEEYEMGTLVYCILVFSKLFVCMFLSFLCDFLLILKRSGVLLTQMFLRLLQLNKYSSLVSLLFSLPSHPLLLLPLFSLLSISLHSFIFVVMDTNCYEVGNCICVHFVSYIFERSGDNW